MQPGGSARDGNGIPRADITADELFKLLGERSDAQLTASQNLRHKFNVALGNVRLRHGHERRAVLAHHSLRAGMPAMVARSSTSFVTTAPAPTTHQAPTLTPGRMRLPIPSRVPSPMQ